MVSTQFSWNLVPWTYCKCQTTLLMWFLWNDAFLVPSKYLVTCSIFVWFPSNNGWFNLPQPLPNRWILGLLLTSSSCSKLKCFGWNDPLTITLTLEAVGWRSLQEDQSSELQLPARIRSLWAHTSCRSRTCSKSQTHVLRLWCCLAPFCRSLYGRSTKYAHLNPLLFGYSLFGWVKWFAHWSEECHGGVA